MASRMEHYLVGRQLLEQFPEIDQNAFLMGIIIPDAWIVAKVKREQSHFTVLDEQMRDRGSDCHDFVKTYLRQEISDLLLGYYVHLLMDNLYLTAIQKKVKFTLSGEAYEQRKKVLAQDQLILNGILARKNHLVNSLTIMDPIYLENFVFSMDDQRIFLDLFQKDFEVLSDGFLQVLSEQMMESYFSLCMDICTEHMRKILDHSYEDSCEMYLISY